MENSNRHGLWSKTRGLSALASLAALSTTTVADGNVTAYVDASGDLWMIADDLDNGVRVQAGGDDTDTFLVDGIDATTTINGQRSVTFVAPGTRMVLVLGGGNNRAWMGTDYGGNPSCCYRQLVVVGGAGDDELALIGGFRSVTADLGPGNDSISVDEGAGGIGGTLLLGDGDDVISVAAFCGLGGFVDMGPGNDLVSVGRESGISGTIDLGSGDDRAELGVDYGDFDLRGGTGDDELEIDGMRRGRLTLDAGDGRDRVRLTGDVSHPEPWSSPIDPVRIELGAGDDHLEIGEAALGAALLDGGDGEDGFVDLGRNDYAGGPPELRAFELPKGMSGRRPDAPTRITGRVVADDDEPVPGAVVLLPELGLRATTDAGGSFQLDPVLDARLALELVVGATVRGRARSGSARVELEPFAPSDAGEIELEPGLRNVLVHGATPSWDTDAKPMFEGNLLALGFRPAEVTRLENLPEDLAPYGVVWHIGGAIPADEQDRLVGFVRSGRGLHLCRGSPRDDASLAALVNRLVRGGGIAVGVSGTATNGFYSFNPTAAGGITTTPNALGYFHRSAWSRYVTGLAPRNVLLTMSTSPDVPGAVWDSSDLVGGRGQLTLLTDNGWIGPGESLDVIENLQAFLQREPEGQTR